MVTCLWMLHVSDCLTREFMSLTTTCVYVRMRETLFFLFPLHLSMKYMRSTSSLSSIPGLSAASPISCRDRNTTSFRYLLAVYFICCHAYCIPWRGTALDLLVPRKSLRRSRHSHWSDSCFFASKKPWSIHEVQSFLKRTVPFWKKISPPLFWQ